MKTKFSFFLTLVFVIIISKEIFSQSTNSGPLGNLRTPFNFLGYNGGIPGILNIRNDFNFPIIFRTGLAPFTSFSHERMRINHIQNGNPLLPTSLTYPVTGTSTTPNNGLTRIGFVYDSNVGINLIPLSLLHGGDGNLSAGVRPWMDLGLLFTRGTDYSFFGTRQKDQSDITGRTSLAGVGSATVNDANDAVIAFGDNSTGPVGVGSDNLTFIFSNGHQPATNIYTGPNFHNSTYGREIMRMNGLGNIGIGPVFFDNAQPQNILHINNNGNNATYVQITNSVNTGQTATDGFHIGITAGAAAVGGIAELKQFENKDMRFFTNNTQRMVIKDNLPGNIGRVGINTNTPANRLTINSATGDPGAGSAATPGGSSGIRTINMTSLTPTITNPGFGVVSVNAVGDFIYVPNGTGGGGTIAAQNGLSLVGTNTVELGGTLIHPLTVINFSTNALQYKEASTLRYQRDANGTVYQLASGGVSVGQPAGFSDFTFITNTNGGVGKLVQTFPVSSFALAGAGIIGEEILTYGTPTTGIGGINGNVTGVYAVAQNTASSTGNNYAVNAWAQGASPSNVNALNIGVRSSATGGQNNYGFYSEIQGAMPVAIEDNGIRIYSASNPGTTSNMGGNFTVSNGQNVYGLKIYAQSGTSTNYGIYTESVPSNTSVPNYALYAKAPTSGTLSTTPSYAGYFQGDVVTTGSDNFTSDQNLKQNLDTISDALGIIKQLKPKTFDYKQSSYPSMNLPGGKQYGLVAQDVQPIFPELINTITHPAEYDTLGNITTPSFTYLALEYQQLTPILIRAVQQLSSQTKKQDSLIQAMQSQIAALTSSVNSCCSSSAIRQTTPTEQNQLTVNLSDKDIIVLNQNVPNPFAEQTTITYNLPEQYKYAQIIFSTIDGRILKAVDVNKKGRGTLTVFGNDLSSGLYTYSLIIDGKTFDTKKMVKSE